MTGWRQPGHRRLEPAAAGGMAGAAAARSAAPLALSAALAVGDLGVIALFGTPAHGDAAAAALSAHGGLSVRRGGGDGAGAGWALPAVCSSLMERGVGRPWPRLNSNDLRFRYEDMQMEFDLQVEERRVPGRDRPQRRRQEHAAGADRRLRARGVRQHPHQRPGVTAAPAERRPVTMLFQDHNLFAHLTVAAECRPRHSSGVAADGGDSGTRSKRRWSRSGSAASRSGCRRRCPAANGSAIALARSLVRDRPVLLLDEPFAALGPALRREMLDLVRALQAGRRASRCCSSPISRRMRCMPPAGVAFIAEGRVARHWPGPRIVVTPVFRRAAGLSAAPDWLDDRG